MNKTRGGGGKTKSKLGESLILDFFKVYPVNWAYRICVSDLKFGLLRLSVVINSSTLETKDFH